jgi:tRNA (adenine57-N1/adenine58-N1)-methyltransferase catalytic subunit
MRISEGQNVLIFYQHGKTWLTKVSNANKLHTHLGVINFKDIIGLEFGSKYVTNKDKTVYLLEPTIYDFIIKSERKTQIVYPKDLGFIAARTGLKNGCKVIEIGTGSAALTTFFASIVKPEGHIFTFDINEEFMKIARKNLEKAGLQDFVTMHLHNLYQGLEIVGADIAVIDLGDPWNVLEIVHKSLKLSGSVVAICPTVNQIEKTAIQMRIGGFTDIEAIEIITRNIEAREGMTRPSMRMIGHTTYLIFARKILE